MQRRPELLLVSSLTIVVLFATSDKVACAFSCLSAPCQNGGECFEQPNLLYGYACKCRADFDGYNCQNKRNITLPAGIRVNNGQVSINTGETVINVGAGVSISDTSALTNAHGNNKNNAKVRQGPCLNGGSVVLLGLPCKCPPGFSGNICERANNNNGVANVRVQSSVFTSACSSFPCRNNGLCQPAVGQPGGYTCICMANFYGVRCDYTKTVYQRDTSRILGISLGTVLPFLFMISVSGLCFYCCCIRKKSVNRNDMFFAQPPIAGYYRPNVNVNSPYGFNPMVNQQQQLQQQQGQQYPLNQEAFVKMHGPPAYEEISRQHRV